MDDEEDGADPEQRSRELPKPIGELRSAVAAEIVGRDREMSLLLAALAAGRDLVLEGPPGTSKSTLLRAIAGELEVPLLFVEGNADLTPSKLIGHHDPARVLQEGYRDDNFVDGPLVRALREGGLLYIEEFNRAPDDTLNTLLTAVAERDVTVPRVGRVTARPGFRVVATMNPYDNVGTSRLSMSIRDRFNRIRLDYQDADDEQQIVALRAPADEALDPAVTDALREDAVALCRATREHPDVRHGSSVRGAIDLTLVGTQLLAMHGITETGGEGPARDDDGPRRRYADAVLDAMLVALSGRIQVDEAAGTSPEALLREIWEDHFLLSGAAADPGDDPVAADSPVRRSGRRRGDQLQPLRRRPKELDTEPTLYEPAGGSGGAVLSVLDERRASAIGDAPGSTDPGVTDEPAQEVDAPEEQDELDARTLRRAREIAARLSVPQPPRTAAAHRGLGELATVPYRGQSTDLDIDATVENIAAEPVPRNEDIVVRERLRTRRALVLVIDVSGSMRGERIRTAAATVGALASNLDDDDVGVTAFWSDAAVLVELGEPVDPDAVLEQLLRIPAKGLTNVSFPLEHARRQLAGTSAVDARVLLLSDCVHNAGPDPRIVAETLPRLDVLLDTSGEKDVDLARDLARTGHGRLALIRSHRDVAPAVSELFAP